MTAYQSIRVLGGTAGNVVANRISEDPRFKVLVIEAGPSYVVPSVKCLHPQLCLITEMKVSLLHKCHGMPRTIGSALTIGTILQFPK
jgi:choline dehydrogenase-like flavoprotein